MISCFEKIINKYAGIIAFVFVLIGFIIIVLFLLITPFNDWSFNADATSFGQYGDFIGGFIGTIFSLAGFFLLYKTLITQQEAIAKQDFASRQDRFEVTFFNLLKNQNDIVNDIRAYAFKNVSNNKTNVVVGRDFFLYSKKELQDIWNSLKSRNYLGYFDENTFWNLKASRILYSQTIKR